MSTPESPKETTGTGKVGVYVCYCGGNISDQVEVEKVCESLRQLPEVGVARSNMFMCSDPGQELIIEDIKSGKVDRVVIASCSPRLHETTFRSAISRAGGNPYLYEHANVREQVSWVHHGSEATAKANRLVAAAVAKAALSEPLQPIRVDVQQRAAVLGGGVAGMKAALELADRGLEVILIERSPFLGGQVARLRHLAPFGEDAAAVIAELAGRVQEHPAITVQTCAQVEGFDGYIGQFRLQVRRRPPEAEEYADQLAAGSAAGAQLGDVVPFVGIMPQRLPENLEEQEITVGAIILATGMRPYQPLRGEYGYGDLPQVLTLPEFTRLWHAARSQRQGDLLVVQGRRIRHLAIIHCVGSRHIPGVHDEGGRGYLNEYCSRTCCTASLYTANLIRQTYPNTRVYEFYRDMRAFGRGQEELYAQASDSQVMFFRFRAGEEPQISPTSEHPTAPVLIRVKDVLTFNEELEVMADLVVLAVGQEANPVPGLVELMKLPVGADRFLLEVHPKLRPVEVAVAGIYLAGTCQAPFDVGETCSAAAAAAVKAAAVLTRGYVELDPFVAEVDLSRCQGTGACVEACLADGALTMVDMTVDGQNVRRAQVNPALCLGCGACVAVCPHNAINVKGWTLKQYEAMVDAIVAEDLAA